ncbi:MAG: hypothetical protein ACRDWB_06365, partial [Acidimicrobiales bacterium]
MQLRTYRLPSGHLVFANTSAPKPPLTIAPALVGILGLSDAAPLQPLLASAAGEGTNGAATPPAPDPRVADISGPAPCATATSAGGYSANQIAHAYGFDTGAYSLGRLGAGKTVALYELEPFSSSDIGTYQTCYGISAGDLMTDVTTTLVDGGAGAVPASGEAALDIETVTGLAPQASINVYEAPNSGIGPFDAYRQIAEDDRAQVVSTSWGLCEPSLGLATALSEELVFEQMAAQGQSLLAATGDSGSEDCHRPGPPTNSFLAVDDPASDPFVTGVGGTDLTSVGTPPAEVVWNEPVNSVGAGGGGISTFWSMPSWQNGVGVNAGSSGAPCAEPAGTNCREVPDVSADADLVDGYSIYLNGRWRAVGGTSAGAPVWAALVALADQGCNRPAGLLNPALYAHPSAFNDITSGNNDFTPSGNTSGLYPAGPGYDMASGLGTPTAALLAPGVLCPGSTTSLAVTNQPVTSVQNTTFPVGVAAESSSGSVLTGDNADPVTLTITPGSGAPGATLRCTANPVTVAGGVAAFACSIDAPGPGYTLTATSGSLGPAVTMTFAITAVGGGPSPPQAQTIRFTAPGTGTAGASATLVATASSGLAVSFGVDPSSGRGVCSVSRNTVTYQLAGNCLVDANQAGNSSFAPAPEVTQTIVVSAAQTPPSPSPSPGGYDLVGNDGGVFVFEPPG